MRGRPLLRLLKSHNGLVNVIPSEAVPAIKAFVERPLQRLVLNRHRGRWLPILAERLSNPHLRNPLGADWWHPSVKRVVIKLAIYESGEEDHRVPLARAHFKVEPLEESATTVLHFVEIHEHRRDALPAACAEGAPSLGLWVDTVVVLNVPLAIGVSRNLRQLHVAVGLVRELLDLLHHHWTRCGLLGQVACEACPPFGCLTTCDGVCLRALQ
mmetsp:Transcript_7296/g.16016  ORF Transcript_7296/g.16016 Transcript_7296/m.16016 type:complete len:213 (+) Transcript_7296:659-1297(+)